MAVLRVPVLLILIKAASGFLWTSSSRVPGNVTIEVCAGQDVTLDWAFQTTPAEHVQTVEWYRRPIGGGVQDDSFIGIVIDGHLHPAQSVSTQMAFVPSAGLKLEDVKSSDSAMYSAHVTVTSPGQVVTHVQHAIVKVKDSSNMAVTMDGQLHAELLSQAVNGTVDATHLTLACGSFDDFWADKIKVVWTTPVNKTLPSTSYANGRFLLTVPSPASNGDYSCSIDSTSPAAACIINGTSAKILQASGTVKLDALEARLAQMQAQLQMLMAHSGVDVKNLENQVHQLESQNHLLQNNFNELIQTVEDLRNQNTNLQHKLEEAAMSVAFHARKETNSPTYAAGDTVHFEEVLTNQGGGYDNTTGVFVAPVNGTYAFHTTVVLDHQSPQRANRHVKLMADDKWLCSAVTSFKDHFEMGSCDAVVQLTAGQRIYVVSDNDGAQFIGSDNTFSGALLHADVNGYATSSLQQQQPVGGGQPVVG